MVTYKHHIIPRHMGGSDDPSNLVKVTAEEHANLHLALYLEHGKREDWVAYRAVAGHIGKEEIIRERARLGARHPNVRTPEVNKKRGRTGKRRPRSTTEKKLISQRTKEEMNKLPKEELDKMKANGKRQGLANRKSYKLLKENGDIITIVGQVKFCRENKIEWNTIKKYSRLDKFYNGYKLL